MTDARKTKLTPEMLDAIELRRPKLGAKGKRLRLPKGHPNSLDVIGAEYGLSKSAISRLLSNHRMAKETQDAEGV